ncbi:MAG: hypothetical protein Q8M88_13495 [Phenylobacterium sp.]|uniref:hypothetical protein n=1 Tax=Phenylobacterium sp. TaxID=1871053 RepID=UPI00273293EB|nr:hypothetical protein [Phenylobacterium sp.]MDP3175442.1 hypothetical protein [Phenylobacterium sp.]
MAWAGLEGFVAGRSGFARHAAAAAFRRADRVMSGVFEAGAGYPPSAGQAEAYPVPLYLRCRDETGRETQRIVTIHDIAPRGAATGFCHLREDIRTFPLERIIEVFDVGLDEASSDAARFFSDHPLLGQSSDAERAAIDACKDELVLLTMTGPEGRLSNPGQQDIALGLVHARRPNAELDEPRLRRLLSLLIADETAFHAALARLKRASVEDKETLLRRLTQSLETLTINPHPTQYAFVAFIERSLLLS